MAGLGTRSCNIPIADLVAGPGGLVGLTSACAGCYLLPLSHLPLTSPLSSRLSHGLPLWLEYWDGGRHRRWEQQWVYLQGATTDCWALTGASLSLCLCMAPMYSPKRHSLQLLATACLALSYICLLPQHISTMPHCLSSCSLSCFSYMSLLSLLSHVYYICTSLPLLSVSPAPAACCLVLYRPILLWVRGPSRCGNSWNWRLPRACSCGI